MIAQCKRNSTDSKVGRPTIQQFKGVIEEQNAMRGYIVATSAFTEEAIDSAELSDERLQSISAALAAIFPKAGLTGA